MLGPWWRQLWLKLPFPPDPDQWKLEYQLRLLHQPLTAMTIAVKEIDGEWIMEPVCGGCGFTAYSQCQTLELLDRMHGHDK